MSSENRPDSLTAEEWLLGQVDFKYQSKEDVLKVLTLITRQANKQGFVISGSITVDDKRTCPNCNYQMAWIPRLKRYECPKCMKMIVDAAKLETKPTNLSPPVIFADAPLCRKCGNIMQRSGTCYACVGCGETSGCS